MTWFHELSSSMLAMFVVLVTIVVAIGGLALSAARVRRTGLHEQLDNGAIAGLLAALIGVYAIAAGLTAVAVWDNTVDAGNNVAKEAAAITVLFHDLGGYPQPLRDQTRGALVEYVRYVVDKEWPLHQHGEAPAGPMRIIDDAQRAVMAFEPATEGQKIVHARVLAAWDKVIEMRRLRLQAVGDTALPGALWATVVLLGVIAISACFLLRLDNFRLHTLITALVAAPIALVVYFIAVTDRPFQGGVSVSAEPYRAVLEEVMQPAMKRGG